MKCLFCDLETPNPKFCNSSCAAKYNNSRRNPMAESVRDKISQALIKKTGLRFFSCLQCDTISDSIKTNRTKFCSSSCSAKYRQIHVTYVLIENGKCSSSKTLKKYLIEKFGETCKLCGQNNIHNNLPLVLQLDHIDGDSDNNFPSNLRLLCPNCHTQTETYSAKGRGNLFKKDSQRNKNMRHYKGYEV